MHPTTRFGATAFTVYNMHAAIVYTSMSIIYTETKE